MRATRSETETKPSPGWKPRAPRATAFVNPRAPSVPATLHLSLEEYFASAALIGIIAAQGDEPDKDWASEWALEQGAIMAAKARERRARR